TTSSSISVKPHQRLSIRDSGIRTPPANEGNSENGGEIGGPTRDLPEDDIPEGEKPHRQHELLLLPAQGPEQRRGTPAPGASDSPLRPLELPASEIPAIPPPLGRRNATRLSFIPF